MPAMKRFNGKVSYIKRNGTMFARGVYREDGKPKQVWRKVEGVKADAKVAVINEIEARLNPVVEKPREKTFRDLAEYYKRVHCIEARFEEDVKIAGKKTYKIMLLDVGLLEKHFGDALLKDITRDDILAYKIKALDEPVRRVRMVEEKKEVYYKKRSLATVHHHLRTLRSMFSVAYENRWLDRLPSFKELISAASEKSNSRIPTRGEFERILRVIDSRPYAQHLKAVVLFITDVGARPIEIWNLEWKAVEENFVTLMSDKGKQRRYDRMALTAPLKEELAKLPRINNYVFGGIKSVKTAWGKIQKHAETDLRLYDLRHLHASRLKELGYDSMDVMKAMRHTKLTTTDRYVKVPDEVKLEMAARLSANPYLPIQDVGERPS